MTACVARGKFRKNNEVQMKLMMATLLALGLFATGCASRKVIVKKDTCVDIYGGSLMECESVERKDTK